MPDTATDTSVAARSFAMGDVLRRSALRDPDKTAIVYRDVRQTYRELDAVVNRAANALAERGVGKGDRVALLAHNSHGFVVAYFALVKLGVIAVPINFMLRAKEVAFILEHAEVRGAIVEDELLGVAQAAIEQAGIAVDPRAVMSDAPAPPP